MIFNASLYSYASRYQPCRSATRNWKNTPTWSPTVMILTSSVITGVPDLTSAELKDYLQQIGLTASEMKRIINSLLLFAEVSRADAPLRSVQMNRVVANVQDRLSHMIWQQQAQIILPETWPDAIGYVSHQCPQAWRAAAVCGTGGFSQGGRYAALLDA
jgi:signal transduction histidine kinase